MQTIHNISFREIEANGPPGRVLIFMPGIGTFKENYINHALAFKPLYSGIFLLDLPEQGSSGDWRIGVMAEQLREFIKTVDKESINRIDLIGHSAGSLAVLSFLLNHNSHSENILFSENSDALDNGLWNIPEMNMINSGFGSEFPELKKIGKIVLYAPPDSFNTVFKRRHIRALQKRSEKFLRIGLNVIVNKPTQLLRFLKQDRKVKLTLNKIGKPQYFNLVIQDHKRFLNYMARNRTVFEIYHSSSPEFRKLIQDSISRKQVLIQYGGNDWLLKPFKNSGSGYEDKIRIAPEIVIVRHKRLGHMLNKTSGSDINMNLQMVTNEHVLQTTKSFITNDL
jgi:pimeloyl-ACP methyl ester carboxylesterase